MRVSARHLARVRTALFGAIVAATIVGTATPAHATTSWAIGDNMEVHGQSAPTERFVFATSNGYLTGSIKNDPPTDDFPIKAHSGTHYAHPRAGSYGTVWGSVGKDAHITPVANGNRPTCTFSAWAYAGYVQFNVEVIDPDSWTYIAVATVQHATGWQYQKMSTPTFKPTVANVFLRVSLLGPYSYLILAHVDDFGLSCTY